MAIIEAYKDIFGGTGGANQDSIPVYTDHNAPFGGQAIGSNGLPLMLKNSYISGIHYVVVDPSLVTEKENDGDRYMTFKDNGEVNYIQIWIMDENGKGIAIQPGIQSWVEYTHLKPYNAPLPPEPPEPPAPTGKQYKVELTISGTITEL